MIDRVGALLGAWPTRMQSRGEASWRAELPGGRVVRILVPGSSRPVDLLRAEVAGARALAATNGVAVPAVIAAEDDLVVTSDVEQGPSSREAAARFGRELARTHLAASPVRPPGGGGSCFGAPWRGFIGPLELPNEPPDEPGWPAFYRERRLAPYLRLARNSGALGQAEARAVEAVCDQVEVLAGDPQAPALIHGDLWSGNLVWTGEPRVWVVDTSSVHVGHRETDLAMLALFGAPHLGEILEAYADECRVWGRPLTAGWQARVSLHQLHPLLVHAALFGGQYGAQAARAARSALDGV